MSEGSGKPWQRKDSRTRRVLAFATILAMALAGVGGIGFWAAIPSGAVALLFISDRGQHRWLAERFENMPRDYVVALSVGAHLLNNLAFCALAFGAGGLTWVFWFEVLEGHAGAWRRLLAWGAYQLAVLALMGLAWRASAPGK